MLLLFDRTNVPDSMYPHYILPALAEVVPSRGRYTINLYDRGPPKLVISYGTGRRQ